MLYIIAPEIKTSYMCSIFQRLASELYYCTMSRWSDCEIDGHSNVRNYDRECITRGKLTSLIFNIEILEFIAIEAYHHRIIIITKNYLKKNIGVGHYIRQSSMDHHINKFTIRKTQ